MSLESDAAVVAAHCEKVLPLTTASLGDEYFYQSLTFCVIDAVFSIGVHYSGVQSVVRRYCNYTKQRRVRVGVRVPPTTEQEAISAFCERPEQKIPEMMAVQVYGNRQRTSARNGILKADAVVRFAQRLRSHGVDYFQDLPRVADSPQFEEEIKCIPGQRRGLSLQYFWMLAGSDTLIKPDRMVRRFLGATLSREISAPEAILLLRAACERLSDKDPTITPRLLDHEVWKYQREIHDV